MKKIIFVLFCAALSFTVNAGWFGIITARDVKEKFLSHPSLYVQVFTVQVDGMDISSVKAEKGKADGVWKITWSVKNGTRYWSEVYVWKGKKSGNLCMRCNDSGPM